MYIKIISRNADLSLSGKNRQYAGITASQIPVWTAHLPELHKTSFYALCPLFEENSYQEGIAGRAAEGLGGRDVR